MEEEGGSSAESSLSNKQMKEALRLRGISTLGMMERRELVAAMQSSKPGGGAAAAAAAAPAAAPAAAVVVDEDEMIEPVDVNAEEEKEEEVVEREEEEEEEDDDLIRPSSAKKKARVSAPAAGGVLEPLGLVSVPEPLAAPGCMEGHVVCVTGLTERMTRDAYATNNGLTPNASLAT
jgi:hypothetical protein